MAKPQSIPFNIPTITGEEAALVAKLCANPQYFKTRHYTQLCHQWLRDYFYGSPTLLTNSCTQSLELATILIGLNAGDEVIMPSFTYVSTANPVVLKGGIPVFVDIKLGDLNLDEDKIEAAITQKTKAIIVVHYGGIGCNMGRIMEIARTHNLYVIEDNAQGILAEYKGRKLGSFGDISCMSFDFMKNLNCGEGGCITVNNPKLTARLEHIYENGTNRNAFKRDEVPFYTWQDVGSNFYPSDLNAAYLWPQLQHAQEITDKRVADWKRYFDGLKSLSEKGHFELPVVPNDCQHNGHIFFIKLKDNENRAGLIAHLTEHSIDPTWHYVPLHSSDFGQRNGRFHGVDEYSTIESERMLRMPMFNKISHEDIDRVCAAIEGYFVKEREKVLIAANK